MAYTQAPAAVAVPTGPAPTELLSPAAPVVPVMLDGEAQIAEQDPRDLVDMHARLVEMFEEAESSSYDNRIKADRDVDYRDGRQWTDEQVKKLTKRGEPAITHPLIRQKVDYLLGLERAQRTDPRALPRNPNPMDEGGAQAATDALRFVVEQQRYDQTRSRAWEDILVPGWGGIEVSIKFGPQGRPIVTIGRCAWDRMFFDPYSCEVDFSDARYLGMVRWMDRDQAVTEYGEEASRVFDECFVGSTDGTYDDRPRISRWVQWGKRRRVRVCIAYYRDAAGIWQYAEFTKGGFLRYGESPFLDDDGMPEHPYVWRSAYIDRDNNRSGIVRDLIDLQDEVNKRRSKAMHAINTRQTYGNQKIRDVNELRRNLARVDGHVQMEGDAEFGKDFGTIPTADIASGNLQLMQQAMQVFEVLGPNAAMQGKGPQDQSGRAILAQQQGGAIQMGTLSDTLRDMDNECYRKVWRRVRQFWTEQTFIRVTDDEQNLKWVGLNTPMQDPATGYPVTDPMTGQPVMQNNVVEMDIDIIIDDSPHMATLQGEQFGKLVDLAKIGIRFAPKVYLSASDLRNKGELIQMADEAQQQPPDPIKVAAAQAEIQNKQADTAHKAAQAQKAQAAAAETTLHLGQAQRAEQRQNALDAIAMHGILNAPQGPQALPGLLRLAQ